MLKSLRVCAFAFVALLIVAAGELSQAVAEGFLVEAEQQMHGLVNQTRGGRGLGQLPDNSGLKTIARRQAQNMAAAGFIFHTTDLVAQANSLALSYKALGENVGVGPSVEAVEDAFIASPHHFENIVDPEYNALGVGATAGGNGALYFSQNFGALKAAAPPPPPPAQPAVQATPRPVPQQPGTTVQGSRPTAPPTAAPTAPPTPEPAPVVTPVSVASPNPATALTASRPADSAKSADRQSLLRTLLAMLEEFFSKISFWK